MYFHRDIDTTILNSMHRVIKTEIIFFFILFFYFTRFIKVFKYYIRIIILAFVKNEIKSFSGAGTYAAYEARARNADPRVSDVYVLRQEDEGYQKGKVKIFIYCKEYMGYDIGQDQVVSVVQNACSDESFRPIGDLVEVEYSQLHTVYISGSGAFVVTYPEKFRTFANNRNARILNEYKNEIKNYINKPFVGEELCARLVATDNDGVYALDARTNTGFIYPTLIYPPIGKRLAVSGPQMQSVFVDRGT